MDIEYTDALSECILFENMSAEEISVLLDCLMPKVCNLDKNEIVCLAGEPFEGVGIILAGQAAVVKENAEGNRMILALLKFGHLFGEMAAFSGNGKWPATVIAQTPCCVMFMPPDKLVGQCGKACLGHRTMIMNMLGILSNKALALSKKIEFLMLKSIRARTSRYLLEQYEKAGHKTFMLPMNRNELADFLNVARPSLSREMCDMRDEGLIDFHRSSVQLLDIGKLIKEAAE